MNSTVFVESGELNQPMRQGGETRPADAPHTKPKAPVRSEPKSVGNSPTGSSKPACTKTDLILKKLRSRKGVTIDELAAAANWQAHSARGFLSGMVRKKLALTLTSDVGKDGKRRNRIHDAEKT